MRRLWQALLALVALVAGWRSRRRREREGDGDGDGERIVPAGQGDDRAEWTVIVLLLVAALCAVAFMVVYAFDDLSAQHQLLGISIAACFAFLGAAFVVAAKRLVVTEQLEEDYPEPEHPAEQEQVAELLEQSATPFTRKKLIAGAGAIAGGTLVAAAATPALSLGPWLDTEPLHKTPWRKGRRLVDSHGRVLEADAIERETFYTAYAEGASRDELGSVLVVVRLDPSALRLPRERADWAPRGILAFSKICTHAGCAISLYRNPTFAPTQPRPALICPCHYSTFDPARAAKVIFGPAGRALPQLPLTIDLAGALRAAGDLSGPVGPGFSGVRQKGGGA